MLAAADGDPQKRLNRVMTSLKKRPVPWQSQIVDNPQARLRHDGQLQKLLGQQAAEEEQAAARGGRDAPKASAPASTPTKAPAESEADGATPQSDLTRLHASGKTENVFDSPMDA